MADQTPNPSRFRQLSRRKADSSLPPGRIDWQAPAIMVSSFILGLGAAVAHDRFYNAYNGKPVSSGLEQKIIHNIGAAFAIVVKMFLAISTGTVFTQQLWMSLRHKSERINEIDALFAVLSNAIKFRKVGLWARHWMLALLAMITWCLPLAAVFTPGTINVQGILRYNDTTPSKPPQPQQSWSDNQNYAVSVLLDAVMIVGANGTVLPFYRSLDRPSGELSRVALASASQGNILAIQTTYENATYGLSFVAPALKCQSVPEKKLSIFNTSLVEAYQSRWLPGFEVEAANSIGLDPSSLRLLYNAWVVHPDNGTMRDLSNPDWNNETTSASPGYPNTEYFYLPSTSEPEGMVLLACHLYNATYDIDLYYENSRQNVTVKSVATSNEVPMSPPVGTWKIPIVLGTDYTSLVYNAVLFAFNNLVIASATTSDKFVLPLYSGGPAYATKLRQYIEGDRSISAAEIKNVLEELFRNITLSTLSSPSFQLSDAEVLPMNITTWFSENIYVYEPTDLYIAYGSAVACTLACVLWGCCVLVRNGVSYNTDFSTILRTTRRKEFDELVSRESRAGNAPLPPHIKTARLLYLTDRGLAEGGFALVEPAADSEIRPHGSGYEYSKLENVTDQSAARQRQSDATGTAVAGEDPAAVQRQVKRKPVAHVVSP
ncbi:hypothetical protein H2200_008195 [Cladophialophora chaetospira]|uniref:Formylmethionine deformylase-like protein n=1 Tax=Cladophialophora chaetospira TaxID=386627 RepID=A0AA38X5B7_9EURO|nr:hypothetical protein H2200_008195 [Cladophialophora chaetospira]